MLMRIYLLRKCGKLLLEFIVKFDVARNITPHITRLTDLLSVFHLL